MKNLAAKLNYIITPLAVLVLNLLILLFPTDTIAAAASGLTLWFNKVLPSLLPFLIGINILTGLGFVRFLGTLLAPLMTSLFGISGSGGFALAAGLSSGYPIGAKITSELRSRNEITKSEGQRLLVFANNSGPLFILGTVGTMLGNAMAGYLILAAHYLSALLLGFATRLLKGRERVEAPPADRHILMRAYRAMAESRRSDGRSLGAILGGAVMNAMESMLQIGGFIVLFSVINKSLDIIGFYQLLSELVQPWGELLGLNVSREMYQGIFSGIIEITTGCAAIASVSAGKTAIIACAAVVSWGGFSIHAQSANFIAKTDLSTFGYILGKLLHGLLAGFCALLLYPFFTKLIDEAAPVFASGDTASFAANALNSAATLGIVLSLAVILCLIVLLAQWLRRNKRRWRRFLG